MKPMGLGISLLFFSIPAVVLAAGFYLLMPFLVKCGMLPYYAYSLGLGLPLLAMLVASIIAYLLEGNSFTWSMLLTRFNYRPLSLRDLFIVAGIFAVELVLYFLMTRISGWLIGQGYITLPSNLPAFINPETVWTQETINAATGGLPGNWFLFFFSLFMLIINVVGEEFWWRGIVLPRQQLALAGCTLFVHAFLWTFFHGFKYWDLLNLLPLSFGLTFAVLYLNNSSAGLVMHFISNGVGLVPIFLGVIRR